MIVYVYYDMDINRVKVFSTLKTAKAYARKEWGRCNWEDNGDNIHDLNSDYVTIYTREIE